MNKNVLCVFAIICVTVFGVFHSCSDKDIYDSKKDPNYVDPKASKLDFSTSQSVKLLLNYDVPEGFASPFKLYTENPLKNGILRTDLTPIASGINVAGTSNLERTIPSYVTDLYLYSGSMFVPLLSHAKIENGVASFQLMDVEVGEDNGTRAGNAGAFWNQPISHFLKGREDYYADSDPDAKIYKFDLIEPDLQKDVPTEVLQAISGTFIESKIVDEKYYKDATIKVQKGKDSDTGAEVFVSILHSGAGFWNSLSYFVYTGDKELTELPKTEVEALEIINIFQYADVYFNTVMAHKKNIGLTPGKYVQLLYRNEKGDLVKEFPVGAQIGWILHSNAFNSGGFTVNNSARVFSVSYWNDKNNKTNDPNVRTDNYNIFFSATDNTGYVYNCFGFEDQTSKDADGDCNDVVFHVLTNPVDAIIAPPSITEEDIEETESKKGILAFEDNWPEKGDYDLNDVVVKYSSDITYVYTVTKQNGSASGSSDVTVKKVEDNFSFIHNGAEFKNKFSYKVGVSPNNIAKITVTEDSNGNETDYTNKIVKDGNGFIIDLAYNTLPSMETGATPKSYTVLIEFKNGAVLQDDFATIAAPYNPFIQPEGNYKGIVEVHLPMYAPTGRVNMDWFGEADDRSDKKSLWYVSGENIQYPFALHLTGATGFRIPAEEKEISTTYPDYLKWVESGMTDYKDWYK